MSDELKAILESGRALKALHVHANRQMGRPDDWTYPEPPVWQEIEDAPYGETLLLFVPGTGVTVGHLSSGEFVIDLLNECRETYASHWMPFPSPPA